MENRHFANLSGPKFKICRGTSSPIKQGPQSSKVSSQASRRAAGQLFQPRQRIQAEPPAYFALLVSIDKTGP